MKPTKPWIMSYLQGNDARRLMGCRALTISLKPLDTAMPTKLDNRQKADLLDVFKSTCNNMVAPNYFMSWDDFELAYLTPEQVEQARAVSKFTERRNYSYRDIAFTPPPNLAEGISLPLFQPLNVEFDTKSSYAVIPATHMPMLANKHSEIMTNAAEWVIRRAFEVGNLKLTLEWLMRECSSVEAMRYLFPPTLWFLREAGLYEVANSVEDLKKAPRVPLMRPDVRWRMREVNRWWTVRVLLEDFRGIVAPDVSNINPQVSLRATVKFDNQILVINGNLSPKSHEAPGSEWLFFKKWD